jgi:Holliday junction resolvase
MTPEGKVKAKVVKILKELGVYYFMPVSNGMGTMGIFDIVCCVDGVFLGIECKADAKKRPTPLQTRNAKMAAAAGAVVFLVHIDNVKDLEDTINRIKEKSYGTVGGSFWPFEGVTSG